MGSAPETSVNHCNVGSLFLKSLCFDMTTEQPSGQNRKLGRLFRSAVCVCVCVTRCSFMKAQYTHVQMGVF